MLPGLIPSPGKLKNVFQKKVLLQNLKESFEYHLKMNTFNGKAYS
jgi:hypothetical protein